MQTTQHEELNTRIDMLKDAISFCDSENDPAIKQREVLARYEAQLEALGGSQGSLLTLVDGTGTGTPRNLNDRPAAGSSASNQYGTFTVHYASEKQTAFIKSLMDRKDLRPLEGSVALNVARLREQVAATQVNKKAASAIIDRLLALPDLAAAAAPSVRMASEKQVALIAKLAVQKDWSTAPANSFERAAIENIVAGKPVEVKRASAAIDYLFGCASAPASAAVEAGVYVNADGAVYRVYLGQQSGRMLAAKVEGDEFVYAGQADRFLTSASRKMTIEEAAAWGKTTGTCIVCARRLDVPESVDRGIGPVCFAKMGG